MKVEGKSLLVACPVVLPPEPEVTETWNHRPMLLVVNGAKASWADWNPYRRGVDPLYPHQNLGVAWAWNQAFRHAAREGYDYVALISQHLALRSGTAGIRAAVEEYADERGLLTNFAWHCIVLSTALWIRVGTFDEGFSPAYYEDSDYLRRLFLLGHHTPENPMRKVSLVGADRLAVSYKAGVIPGDTYERNRLRYIRKWGGEPFQETYPRPYNVGGRNWQEAEEQCSGSSPGSTAPDSRTLPMS